LPRAALPALLAGLCGGGALAQGDTGPAAAPSAASPEAPATTTALALPPLVATVPPAGQWSFSWSPISFHYSASEEHKHSVAVGMRRAEGGPGFFGGALFTNSFGQPSAYAHYGQRYVGGVPALPRLYVEWSAGLMFGYVRDRLDDVPLNVRGFAPLFLLSSGWQLTPRSSVQLNLAGTAAVMLQFDHRLD
jgi:hypothetical protein